MLLLQFLLSFIESIIAKWLNMYDLFPGPEVLEAHRNDFLKAVKLRFWFGPGREERAAAAFSLAVENYTVAKKDMGFTANQVAKSSVFPLASILK